MSMNSDNEKNACRLWSYDFLHISNQSTNATPRVPVAARYVETCPASTKPTVLYIDVEPQYYRLCPRKSNFPTGTPSFLRISYAVVTWKKKLGRPGMISKRFALFRTRESSPNNWRYDTAVNLNLPLNIDTSLSSFPAKFSGLAVFTASTVFWTRSISCWYVVSVSSIAMFSNPALQASQ